MYVCGRKKGKRIISILAKTRSKREFDAKFKELIDNGVITTKDINIPTIEVVT